jgi:hypothetical protein
MLDLEHYELLDYVIGEATGNIRVMWANMVYRYTTTRFTLMDVPSPAGRKGRRLRHRLP